MDEKLQSISLRNVLLNEKKSHISNCIWMFIIFFILLLRSPEYRVSTPGTSLSLCLAQVHFLFAKTRSAIQNFVWRDEMGYEII